MPTLEEIAFCFIARRGGGPAPGWLPRPPLRWLAPTGSVVWDIPVPILLPAILPWIPGEEEVGLPRFIGRGPLPGEVPIPFYLAAGGGPACEHLRGEYVDPYTFRYL